MDLMTILGAACGMGVIYYILWVGQMTRFLLNSEAIILVFGGTLGSVMISYPWSVLRRIPMGLRMMIFPPRRPEAVALIRAFGLLAEKSRREGLDALESELAGLPHPF